VGPSGQWHCRPAPRLGWLPWAVLSERVPCRYLDVISRVRSRAAAVSCVQSRAAAAPVSEANLDVVSRSDASPASPPFRLPCPSATLLPRSEAVRHRCSGKPLHRRVFTPLTTLLLLRRSPQRRESPPSRATERHVAGRLTAAPLLLHPSELAAPPVLLRSHRHSKCIAGPPSLVKSPPPSTRAAPPPCGLRLLPPLWAARPHSSGSQAPLCKQATSWAAADSAQ
jgi:hypothetical protein